MYKLQVKVKVQGAEEWRYMIKSDNSIYTFESYEQAEQTIRMSYPEHLDYVRIVMEPKKDETGSIR